MTKHTQTHTQISSTANIGQGIGIYDYVLRLYFRCAFNYVKASPNANSVLVIFGLNLLSNYLLWLQKYKNIQPVGTRIIKHNLLSCFSSPHRPNLCFSL